MLAIVAAITITVTLGFPVTRYRASFDTVTAVLAAVALDALWRRWRPGRHDVEGDVVVGSPAPLPAPVEVAG